MAELVEIKIVKAPDALKALSEYDAVSEDKSYPAFRRRRAAEKVDALLDLLLVFVWEPAK
jgi:hypothetical protein